MNNAIEALKEFFFDIIGYFIPGFLIILLSKLLISINFNLENNVYVTIILSYLLGYVLFSITLIKDKWVDKISEWSEDSNCKLCELIKKQIISKYKIEKKLLTDDTYIIASKYIKEETSKDSNVLKSFNSFRSYAMSVAPLSDKKVYTFMFRAELFNQIHTISILGFFVVLIKSLSFLWTNKCFIETFEWQLILLFFVLIITLRKGWQRFYGISMRIPFSIYLAKIKHKNDE